MGTLLACVLLTATVYICLSCSLPILFCIALLFTFFLTEKWWWHKNPATEERVLGLWASLFASTLLFYDDSWISFLRAYRHWILDILVVVAAYFLIRTVAFHKEQMRIDTQSRGVSFRAIYRQLFNEGNQRQWRPRAEASKVLTQTLDYITALRSPIPDFNRAMWKSHLETMEKQILDGLTSLSNEELSEIVTCINMGSLFASVRDQMHSFSAVTHNKTRLLQFLCVERLAALDAPARAAILNGMQASGVFRYMGDEATKVASFVLRRTYGESLHLVKSLLDSTGNYHNLHKLIYFDLENAEKRAEVLDHIAREGRQYKNERRANEVYYRRGSTDSKLKSVRTLGNIAELRSMRIDEDDEDAEPMEMFSCDILPDVEVAKRVREADQKKPVKILSDIDDTLTASGGDNIAGVDGRLPAKTVYPGVLAFYKQLDLGPLVDSNEWPEGRCGNLVFLSARPHIYKDATESASFVLFEQLKKERGLHCTPALLAGNLASIRGMRASVGSSTGPSGVYLADFHAILAKKFQNLSEYKALYPEYRFVLVGDNGQADVAVADKCWAGRRISCAFFHLVKPLTSTFGYDETSEARWASQQICFFKTYVGAAIKAKEFGLISNEGLRHVVASAIADVQQLLAKARQQKPTWWLATKKAEWIKVFNEDLADASEYLHTTFIPIVLTPEDLILPGPGLVSLAAGSALEIGRRVSGSISPQIRRFSGMSITSNEVKAIEAMDGSPLAKTSSASQTSFNESVIMVSGSVASLPTIIFSEDSTEAAGVAIVLTAHQASEADTLDTAAPGQEIVHAEYAADGLRTSGGGDHLPNGIHSGMHELEEGSASPDSTARATHSSSVPSFATHDDIPTPAAAPGPEAGHPDTPDAASAGSDAASIKSESADLLDEDGERRRYHTLTQRLDPGRRTIG